jgi:hypothetical protein
MDRVPIVRLHRMVWSPLIGLLMYATASLAIVSPCRAGATTPAAFTNLSILGASPAFETSRQVLAAGFNEATYAGPLGPYAVSLEECVAGFCGGAPGPATTPLTFGLTASAMMCSTTIALCSNSL